MRHRVPIFGRALLLALLAITPGRSRADPPEPAPSCGQRGRVIFDATTTLVDSGGHPVARFSGGESAVTFVSPPLDGGELAKIETGTGRGSFRLSGYVKASALRLYTSAALPIVDGHVWLDAGTRVIASGVSAGKVRVEKPLSTPFNQRFRTSAACSLLTFVPPTPPAPSVPGAARVFLLKGAELELFASVPPVGPALLTLVRAPELASVPFYSREQRGGFVHVQYHGEINVDAWAKAEQLTPMPRGETIDVPPSTYSLATPPELQLPMPPRSVKVSRELPLRLAARDSEPSIGVIEADTDVFVLDVVAGWAKVLPKSLHVLPYGDRSFWARAADLEL